jgi:hypothetical protein
MARRSRGSGDGPSLDSLLDTMTNVVGILVIVLVVTQLGVRDAVKRITSEKPKEVIEKEIDEKKEELATAVAARKEAEQRRNELLADLKSLSKPDDDKKLKEELDVLDGQLRWKRDDLTTFLKKREGEQAAHMEKAAEARKLAEEFKKKEDELRKKVVAAQEQEATILALLDNTPMREVAAAKVVNLPNPRKAPEGATPKYMICREGKLYPWSRDEMRKGAQERAEQLVGLRNLAANPKTGIEDAKLVPMFDKLRLNDDWFLLKLKANGRQPRLVFERKRNAGYAIEDLENPRGPYIRILKTIDPSKHYLRFTVWTDSYEVYLVARRIAAENGLLAGWDITSSTAETDMPLGGKILFGPKPPPMPVKPNTNPPKPPAKPIPVDTID